MIEIMVGGGTQVRLPVSASPDLAAAVVRALVRGSGDTREALLALLRYLGPITGGASMQAF